MLEIFFHRESYFWAHQKLFLDLPLFYQAAFFKQQLSDSWKEPKKFLKIWKCSRPKSAERKILKKKNAEKSEIQAQEGGVSRHGGGFHFGTSNPENLENARPCVRKWKEFMNSWNLRKKRFPCILFRKFKLVSFCRILRVFLSLCKAPKGLKHVFISGVFFLILSIFTIPKMEFYHFYKV